MMLRDINQQQEYAIYVLNDRLSNVETEGKSFFFVLGLSLDWLMLTLVTVRRRSRGGWRDQWMNYGTTSNSRKYIFLIM